jgi:hypothetical protein
VAWQLPTDPVSFRYSPRLTAFVIPRNAPIAKGHLPSCTERAIASAIKGECSENKPHFQ